jgi:hypothetical protein
MSKRKKLQRRNSNPDFRARNNLPAPSIEEIERRLGAALTPSSFVAAQHRMSELQMRQRVLTLPVMVAIVLSLVWRRIPYLSELLRVLEKEGLFDLAPVKVTKQALSQRLQAMPAELFVLIFNEAQAKINREETKEVVLAKELQAVRRDFTNCYVADGSTLEALRKQLKGLTEEAPTALGGKMMGVLDLFTRRATRTWYTEDAAANDKSFGDQMLDFIEAGSVTVFDLGFFSFPFFDKFTDQQKYFVTRLREKTAYQTVAVLSEGKLYRDEIIAMGRYRSNPCTHHVRLVSVLWGQTRYRYLTNVLDDQKLSARAVCALYRHRWRIEEAFLVTKRLLGLSYLWVGARNAVQIQVYATWLFYAVLTNVCVEVAAALAQPIERISQEMVFRSLYHYARALERGENLSLVPFLVKDAKLFSLIKQERKRDREKAKQNLLVWSSLS